MIDNFLKKVSEKLFDVYLEDIKSQEFLIIAGCGFIKDEFVNLKKLNPIIKEKIKFTISIGYSGKEGIREAIYKLENEIQEVPIIQEKKIIEEFFNRYNKTPNLVEYGETEVISALKENRVDTILIEENALTKELEGLCNMKNSQIIEISRNTEFGSSLIQSFGKICAILRY